MRFLRRYSNYLTPRLGIFSGDSLAAISTYLRNLLLNQLILVAFFGALLTAPYLLLSAARWLVDPNGFAMRTPLGETGLPLIYGLAIAPMVVAVAVCAMSLMRFPRSDRFNFGGQKVVVGWIVVPSLVSAWLLAITLRAHGAAAQFALQDWVLWTTAVYLLPWVLVFFLKMEGFNLAWTAIKKLLALLAALGDRRRLPDAVADFVG